MSTVRERSVCTFVCASVVACIICLTSLRSLLFLPFVDAPKPPTGDQFILPDEFVVPEVEETGRARRSPINSNRVGGLNVETLVVADRKMLEKHGRENVTTYVLTVMNMVSFGKLKVGKEEMR